MERKKKSIELQVLSVLKTIEKKGLEDIAKVLKDESKKAIQKSLDNLVDNQLVIKRTENNKPVYEIAPDYTLQISGMRSLAPESPAEPFPRPHLIDLRDIVANAPPMFIVQAPMTPQSPVQTMLRPDEFAESAVGEFGADSDFYRKTDFESNLESILESNIAWKKELIEILKLVNIQGNHEKAIETYQKAIKIAETKGTKEQVIDLYYKMAKEWEYLNNNPKERDCYLKSMEIAMKSAIPENIIAVYLRLAVDSLQNKNYEQALKEYQEVSGLSKKNNLKKYLYEALDKMAFIYRELNQFENALDYYLQNIPLCKELYPESLASLYNKIGGVLIKLGRNADSVQYFEDAYKIYKQKADKQNQIVSLMNKNVALFNLSRWDDLVELYLQVIDLLENEEQKESLWHQLGSFIQFSSDKNTLKKFQGKIGELKKLGEPKEVAVRMRTETKMAVAREARTTKFSKALWNYNIAVAEFVEGKLKEAKEYYEIAEKYYDELHDIKGIGQCSHHLGVIEIENKNFEEAIKKLLKAAEAYENIKKDVTVEEFRTSLQADVVPVLEDLSYAYILNRNFSSALDALERGKSREIIRNMQGFDNSSACPELAKLISEEKESVDYLQMKEARIAELKNQYIYGEVNDEAYLKEIGRINEDIAKVSANLRHLRTEIYEKCADPGQVQPTLDYSIVNEALKILKKTDITIIELFYYAQRSLIIILGLDSKGNIDQYSKQVDGNLLKKTLEELQTGVDTLNNDIITEIGPKLFELIFPKEFSAKYLDSPSDKPLMIIPHRELYSVPWEILRNPNSKGKHDGYLGLDFPIVRNFSLDLARIMLKKGLGQKGKDLLLLGNPTGDLEGALQEVKALEQTLKGKIKAKMLAKTEVSRENFKESIKNKQFGIIHYAGHADFMESDPSLSVLLLANGPLTARELGLIKINNPLFFLSACETGQAKGTGGGEVFGIIRGLTLAGAQSIVSTNWQVSDETQIDLAVKFYENLKKGMTAAAALREARRHNWIKYNKVLDWASTTIYGNPLFKL